FLRRRPAWFLLAFLALNGVSATDGSDFRILAEDPLALHPNPDRQFLHSSPFTFFVGAPLVRLLGAEAALPLVPVAGLVALLWSVRRLLGRLSPPQAQIVWRVLASTPLLFVLTHWLGKSDPFLVAFYLAIVAGARRPVTRFLLATAMIVCHREIGTLILVLH